MPYCFRCGTQVKDTDRFCGNCGTSQTGAGQTGASASASAGPAASTTTSWQTAGDSISPKTASWLCYIPWLGWIGALYVLATDRFRQMRDVRFHAFQGLYLFVVSLLLDLISKEMMNSGGVNGLFKVAMLGVWIYMLIQTQQGARISLPVIGELAERSVDEQK